VSWSQRGQTLPFWAFGTITILALMFFMIDFTDTVKWHIRAQNAADTAATAAIAADANQQNQLTVALYTLAVDEYKIRSTVQAMINAANSNGTCQPQFDDTGFDCDNAYDQQLKVYDAEVKQYGDTLAFVTKLTAVPPNNGNNGKNGNNGNGHGQGPPAQGAYSAAGAAYNLVASNQYCWDRPSPMPQRVFDCAFTYNVADLSNTGLNSKHFVDVIACRKVNTIMPGFLTTGTPKTYNAVGRAAATLELVTDKNFNPGTTSNPDQPGTVYQPPESCPPIQTSAKDIACGNTDGWLADRSYIVDYKGLNVRATFYAPVPAKPDFENPPPIVCKAG